MDCFYCVLVWINNRRTTAEIIELDGHNLVLGGVGLIEVGDWVHVGLGASGYIAGEVQFLLPREDGTTRALVALVTRTTRETLDATATHSEFDTHDLTLFAPDYDLTEHPSLIGRKLPRESWDAMYSSLERARTKLEATEPTADLLPRVA